MNFAPFSAQNKFNKLIFKIVFFQFDNVLSQSRVAHLGKDSISAHEVLFGCAKAKAVFVPINWRLAGKEVQGPSLLRRRASISRWTSGEINLEGLLRVMGDDRSSMPCSLWRLDQRCSVVWMHPRV